MQASKERAGALVGKREKQPSQTAQAYGKPVAENDVHKAKGQAAGRNHAPSTAKKRLVPLKEEGAIQQVLGTYRSSGYSSIISAQKRGCRLTSEQRNSGAKMRTAKPKRISRMASRRSTGTSCGQIPHH